MPTPMKDYYKILQIDPSAEQEVIEGAYRRLAAKYHPDKNTSLDATTRMQEINEAYETLHAPDRRAAYDLERPAHNEHARVAQERAERERRATAERDEYERLLKEQKERSAEAEHKREEQEEAERERWRKAAIDAEFEMWLRENPNSRVDYERLRRGQVEAQGQHAEIERQQSESAEAA